YVSSGVGNSLAMIAPVDAGSTLVLATREDRVVDMAAFVLTNDSDIDAGASLVATPFTGFSTLGAWIDFQADGSFTYDPNTSATLNALKEGEIFTDEFAYQVNDEFALNDS